MASRWQVGCVGAEGLVAVSGSQKAQQETPESVDACAGHLAICAEHARIYIYIFAAARDMT